MLYKHWKKFALVLTGLFWVGCEEDDKPPHYGVEAELPESSSDGTDLSSADAKTLSSSSVESGRIIEDSLGTAICLYGVSPDIKFAALCYNDSIKTEEGHSFKIIDCTDGNKYMRSPNEANTDAALPEGVQVFAPKAGSDKALNCSEVGDICIERDPDLEAEKDSLAGCHPVIDCPPKPKED